MLWIATICAFAASLVGLTLYTLLRIERHLTELLNMTYTATRAVVGLRALAEAQDDTDHWKE